MKTLAETLKDHKKTNAYATSVDAEGTIPETGETVYNDSQSMVCMAVDIDIDGHITICFDNGQKVAGIQVAEMTAAGIINIK